ncbi:MAG: hypothetical protein I8H91_04500 [Burkholderiales bacterium]|nr:hypothetical protein [Burkholderiales bacterium]
MNSPLFFRPGAKLRHVLQRVQQGAGAGLFFVVRQPDFGLARVGRQFTRHAAQEIALHAGRVTGLLQGVHPQRGNGNIRGTGQAKHAGSAAAKCRALLN